MESTTPGSAPDSAPGNVLDGTLPGANRRIIPFWHTALLLLVLCVFSLLNAESGRNLHSGHARIHIYLATMIYEWLLTGYVWWGLRRAGLSLRELIGGRWRGIEDFLLDIAIAVGTWFGALLVIAVAALAMGMDHSGSIDDARRQIGFLAPQSGLEVILWICLSATAGFCEEVLFRGYLQKQFSRLLRNRWVALLVVSILFGLGHGYEGTQRMLLIALLGLSFGVMSMLRKSLRPAIMAHTLQDTISGLLLKALR
ncbi:MAG: CPBP family intramembrane glutamic endopeptidase [Candidatus Korobacteraceae bacterium]|jgi:membrane protease YdiL (CAAX protease family)